MLRRYDGLTPADVSNYPALTTRQFLNPLNHATNGAATTIPEMSFVVPASLTVSLPYVIHGNPTATSYFQCRTATGGGGTLYSVIMGEGSPASGQVHVEPGTGMLLFHSSAAGATVYITMVAHMSFNDAAYQAWLHANCVRMYDQVFGGSSTQYVAGADVVIGPGYVGTDGLLYQSSPDAWATNATLFITSAATTGNLATVQRSGDVTPKRSMPPNDKIWAGRGGEVTWSGDEDPAYKLVTDDLQQFLGTSDHTGLILILNPNVPVTRFAE